jgi:hypothetical protein
MWREREWRIWADNWVKGNNNAFMVKRKSAGGVQFSRDPLNLVNKHSRKVGIIEIRYKVGHVLKMFTACWIR